MTVNLKAIGRRLILEAKQCDHTNIEARTIDAPTYRYQRKYAKHTDGIGTFAWSTPLPLTDALAEMREIAPTTAQYLDDAVTGEHLATPPNCAFYWRYPELSIASLQGMRCGIRLRSTVGVADVVSNPFWKMQLQAEIKQYADNGLDLLALANHALALVA